jgi:hypothetical protein
MLSCFWPTDELVGGCSENLAARAVAADKDYGFLNPAGYPRAKAAKSDSPSVWIAITASGPSARWG